MITAIINVAGFIKHIKIDFDILRSETLNVPVPRILADMAYGTPPLTATMNVIQFYLKKYDVENHIAYYDYYKWV
jgi:hypothetical protein